MNLPFLAGAQAPVKLTVAGAVPYFFCLLRALYYMVVRATMYVHKQVVRVLCVPEGSGAEEQLSSPT